MKVFRCQLCGGKIRDGRCTLCGWQNQEIRDLYEEAKSPEKIPKIHSASIQSGERRISQPKGKKPTQRERSKTASIAGRQKMPQTILVSRSGKSRKTGKKKRSVWSTVVFLIVVISLFGEIYERFHDKITTTDSYGDSEYVPADYSTTEQELPELPEGGETWTGELGPGIYVVGVDLPEGLYQIQVQQGSGSLIVNDYRNGYYDYYSMNPEPEEDTSAVTRLEDIKLFEGGYVTIEDMKVQLSVEQGQVDAMHSMENPLTETVELVTEEEYTAGKDFPAGVYDISVAEGEWASIYYEIPDEDEDGYGERSLFLDSELLGMGDYVYRNVSFPEGTIVRAEYGNAVLIPSSRIVTEDYMEIYETGYY